MRCEQTLQVLSYEVDDLISQLGLRHCGKLRVPLRRQEPSLVIIGAEGLSAANLIGNDHVGILRHQFLVTVRHHVIGLGSKANNQLAILLGTHGRQDIGIGHQLNGIECRIVDTLL